eukprot:3702898-Karenia_brevis.AAC.1
MEGVTEYMSRQVESLSRKLDDDLGVYARRTLEIEGVCKEKVDDLQDSLVATMDKCLKDFGEEQEAI